MNIMQKHEGRLINIRKLVAWDITLHGPRFILVEFGIGTPAMILFGLWLMIADLAFALGLYVFLVGVNYAPLLLYAIVIVKRGSAESEISHDLARSKQYIRKYGSQQILILLPPAIILVALVQEMKKNQPKASGND